MASTACNEHIAKIAALPRVDRFCVFSQPLLALIKCWNAATSAICRNVICQRGTAEWKSKKRDEHTIVIRKEYKNGTT